jgi:hypothetical protein
MSVFSRILIAALIAGTTIAMPRSPAGTHEHQLDNGNMTVTAITVDEIDSSSTPALFARQSNINCQGSAFCDLLGSSCDDAFRKINPTNTYGTYDGQVICSSQFWFLTVLILIQCTSSY